MTRHTAISNHPAYFQHEGKTAAWARNSPDINQRHYKGLLRQADAIESGQIAPDHVAQMIPFPAVAAQLQSCPSVLRQVGMKA
jgi:hypothetical protein